MDYQVFYKLIGLVTGMLTSIQVGRNVLAQENSANEQGVGGVIVSLFLGLYFIQYAGMLFEQSILCSIRKGILGALQLVKIYNSNAHNPAYPISTLAISTFSDKRSRSLFTALNFYLEQCSWLKPDPKHIHV